MIVTCQNCDARFSLKDGLVKKTGSKVRCSKCKHVFVVYPEESADLGKPSAGSEMTKPAEPLKASTVETKPDSAAVTDQGSITGDDFDLSEIERMLDTNAYGDTVERDAAQFSKSQTPTEKALSDASSGVVAGALDLSEIEKVLAMDQLLEDDQGESIAEPQDLVFDMAESVEDSNLQGSADDFDLSDIEKMLADEMEDFDAGEPGDAAVQSDTLPSSVLPAGKRKGDEWKEEDGLSLDLSDLDAFLETAVDTEKPGKDRPKSGEIDLSDLKLAMESESSSPDVAAEIGKAGEEEYEFKLEMDDDYKAGTAVAAATPTKESAKDVDELDFSGIEEMMETDIQGSSDQKDEKKGEELDFLSDEKSSELSFNLELETVAQSSLDEADSDDFDLQIDDAEPKVQGAPVEKRTLAEEQAKDMEDLDLEFDEDEPRVEDVLATAATEEFREAVPRSPMITKAEEKEESAIAEPTPAPALAQKKPTQAKGSRKSLVWVIILVLLIGAGAGGFFLFGDQVIEWMTQKRIEIPFVTKTKKAESPDAGNLKITTTADIDSQFVKNASAGRLFVITGKAKNGYSNSRSAIRITGKLFTKGKKMANAETVYCGNVMSNVEIAKLSLEEIKSRLGNPKGDNDANVSIKPGEERPFMIVFSNLPENLEEFTVEVTGSEPADRAVQK